MSQRPDAIAADLSFIVKSIVDNSIALLAVTTMREAFASGPD